LTFRELKRFNRQLLPGVWVDRWAELTVMQWNKAGWLWSKRAAVLGSLSAAAALGSKWIDVGTPVELVHTNRRAPDNVVVRTYSLAPGETTTAHGLPVTTPARTAFDLGRVLPFEMGLTRLDALMNATGVKTADIEAVMRCHPRSNGMRRLRKTLAHADRGAESPYESLTRLLLMANNFPVPETQLTVFDGNGFIVARIDMGWREYKVGVDFEGAHHWTEANQFSRDVDRYALLPTLGWNDIRLTSGILHNRPRVFLGRVSDALMSRGCPRTWPRHGEWVLPDAIIGYGRG
jgi:hypothetical protein